MGKLIFQRNGLVRKAKAAKISGGGPPAKPDALSSESIRKHALNTFGSTLKAGHWMNRPNHLLQGKTPEEALKTDPESVEAALVRIDYGVYV